MRNLVCIVCAILFPFLSQAQSRGIEAEVGQHQSVNTRALVVGISTYASQEISPLRYAHVDALAVSDFFKSELNVPADNLQLLLNEKATTGNLIMSLYNIAKNCKAGDRVIIYFSGHGDVETLTSKQSGFLLTYDTNPHVYIASALGVDVVNQFISDMTDKGAKVFMISDACRSGNLAGGTEGIQQASSVLANRVRNEVRLLACQAHEVSIEGSQWGGGRGLFSFEMVNAWRGSADEMGNKDGIVTLLELQRYLITRIPEQAAPGSQNPVISGNVTEILGKVSSSAIKVQPDREALLAKVNSKGRAGSDSLSLSELEKLISTGKLLGEGSAYEYYTNAMSLVSDQLTKDNLKRVMCAAFLGQANSFLNQYLNSKSLKTSVIEVTNNITYLKNASLLLADFPYYTKYFESKLKFYEALLSVRKESFVEAERLLLQSIELEPSAAYAYNELGVVQQQLGKKAEAEKSFNRAIKLSPKWIFAHINLSNLHLSEGRPVEAIKHYRVLLNEGVESQVLYENLAAAYDMVDSAQRAEVFYQKAVNTGKLNQDLLNNISKHYMRIRKYDVAIPFLRKSIALKPTSTQAVEANVMLAVCQYYSGDHNEVISTFEQSWNLDMPKSDRVELCKYAALTYLELGKKAEAEKFLNQYFTLGGDLKIHRDIAAYHISKENYADATRSLNLVPAGLRDDEFYYVSALCLFNQYDYNAAIRAIEKIKGKTISDWADVHLLSGKSQIMVQNYNAAKSALEKSLQIEPTSETWYWLSIVNLLLKNNEDAIKALQQSMSLGGLTKAMIDGQELFKIIRYDDRFINLYNNLK